MPNRELTTTADTALAARVHQRERELTTLADAETCQQVAEMIIGSYPNANPADPRTYTRAVRTLLAGYPASVVAQIADPRGGIVTKCRWPPTVAELHEFAAPLLERMQSDLSRDREAVRQLEDRDPEPELSEAERAAHAEQKLAEFHASLQEIENERAPAESRLDWTRTQCASGEAIQDTDLYRTALSEGEAGGDMEQEE